MLTAARTPSPRPVDWSGRALRGLAWGDHQGAGALVVAVHGITANAAAWTAVAPSVLGGLGGAGQAAGVVAVELRGRGASRHLDGPWGLSRHADDVAAEVGALLEGRPGRRVVLVGHSMGAFTLAALAGRHGALLDRVAGVVLVDGGLPLLSPPGVPAAQAATAALGPALARLEPIFVDPAEHRALWRRHPALPAVWDEAVEAYVTRDLAPVSDDPSGGWRVPVHPDAVAQDMADLYDADLVAPGLERLAAGATPLLTAPRGLDDGAPMYSRPLVDAWRARLPGLRVREVPDVNHYTVLFAPAAADAVTAAVLAPLSTSPLEA